MGAGFSQTEYKGKLNKLNEDYLTLEDSDDLDKFLKASDDFVNVFTSIGLDDFRSIKDAKTDNIVHLVSHAVKIMHEAATQYTVLQDEDQLAKVKGAIHVLNRIFPLLFEEKELFIRCMWREQALFGNQINAITMMESISLLLFKEGFTIQPLADGVSPQYYGIDENLVWRNGISVPAAVNHNNYQFDKNRIDLLRLVITILSQPLFYAPDEYLLVLNPFSTYFSNKRSKNCKNLFVSLINVIVSYDVSGYGVPYLSAIDQGGEQEMLVTLAIHLLLILIEYKPPSLDNLNFLIRGGHISLNKVFQYFMMQSGALKNNNEGPLQVDQRIQEQIIEDLTSNEFFRLLRVIHGRMNLDPLYEGFTKYFQNIIDTNATYLPQSLNIIPFYQEISILLWRFMTLNTHVFEDFTERSDFHQVILLGVIILMDQSKKDPTKSNLMYLTIFLLLTISASRELAMNLNSSFNLSIQLDLVEMKGASGAKNYVQCYTYADLVFVSVYGLIKNGPRLLRPIYKSIIAILSNLAPYTKSLCKEGCDGLMYLVQVFTKKEFLLEKEDNCKTLGSLIEAINYLIAYHDETNHYLQIQLMKYQTLFDNFDRDFNQIGSERAPVAIMQPPADEVQQQQQPAKENVPEDQEQSAQNENKQEPAEVKSEEKVEDDQAEIPDVPTAAGNDMMAAFMAKSVEKQTNEEEKQAEVHDEPPKQDEHAAQQQPEQVSQKEQAVVREDAKEQDEVELEKRSEDQPVSDVKETDEEAEKAAEEVKPPVLQEPVENPYAQGVNEGEQMEGGEDDGNDQASDEDEWEQQPAGGEEETPAQVEQVEPAQRQQIVREQVSYPEAEKVKEGAKIQTKNINQIAQMPNQAVQAPASAPVSFSQAAPRYPEKDWFAEWKKTLNLPNIKACVNHTYNKAMHIRNQMIEQDPSLSSLQIFNIDEDQLLSHLEKFSLKGLLPVMPKILVTTYKGNDSIDTWLISYLWGLIFVFAQEYNVYDHRKFRLFTINTYQGQTNS